MDRIVPYIEFDGSWTFSDTYIRNLWHKMVKEGTHKKLFYGGIVKSADQLVAWLKKPGNNVVIIIDEEDPLALAWINCIEDGRAVISFNIFKKAWGSSKDLLKKCTDYWFSARDPKTGENIIKIIVGFTPSDNRLAIKLEKQLCDGQLEIPNFCLNHYTGKRCSAILSYLENKNG